MKASDMRTITIGRDPWEALVAQAASAQPQSPFKDTDKDIREIRDMLKGAGACSSLAFARRFVRERLKDGTMIAIDGATFDTERRVTIRQRKYRIVKTAEQPRRKR